MKDNEFHQRKSSKESYREHRLMNHYNGFMGKNQCNYIQDHNKLKAKYKTNIQFNPCMFHRGSHTFYTYRHWLSKDLKHYKIQEGISERKIYWYKNLIIHLVHKIKRSQSTSWHIYAHKQTIIHSIRYSILNLSKFDNMLNIYTIEWVFQSKTLIHLGSCWLTYLFWDH